jgi:hypothetical protein
MERQAGLGKSLEEVLDAVPPIEPADPTRSHALFGSSPEDAPVGTSHSDTKQKNKNNKKTTKNKKSDGDKKKTKKQKSKNSKSNGKSERKKR